MKKIIATVGAGLLALGVTGCSTQHQESAQTPAYVSEYTPEEQGYLDYINSESEVPVDDATDLAYGWSVCEAFSAGATLEDVASMGVDAADGDEGLLDYLALLTGSTTVFLCPENQHVFDNYAEGANA